MALRSAIFIFTFLIYTWVHADIQSTQGNIIFDTDSDNESDFVIHGNNFGIATATPQSNLHVVGNSIIESGSLYINSSSGNSTLEVNGSIGFSIETISTNTILSGNSVVMVDTTGGNLNVHPPSASRNSGRTYKIKKITSVNSMTISAVDSNELTKLTTTDTGYPSISIVSNGTGWHITSLIGSANTTDIIGADNLLAYYKLDETSGNTATDSSGNGNDGTLIGLSFSDNGIVGKVGNAVHFVGDDDQVDTPDNSNSSTLGSLSFRDTDSFSVSMWYQGTESASGTWGSTLIGRNSGDIYANFVIRDGKATYQHYDGAWNNTIESTTLINDDQWHHLVYVNYANETGDLYINGVKEVNGLASSINQATRYYTINSIMYGYNNAYTSGNADDVRIYNKSLSAEDVLGIYSLGN